MSFILENSLYNKFTLTNEDPSVDLVYTIHKLGNDGIFSAVTGYTTDPSTILSPSASITIDLDIDGVYAIVTGSPVNYYYFTATYYLRECEKKFDQGILCQDCEACNDCKYIKDVIRFIVLKDKFYFIANKYAQDQSIVDLVTPEIGELLYWEDILEQLLKICTNCHLNRGKKKKSKGNCGC